MKLLLDENLSRRLVPFLRADFPGTTQVALVGLERATDLAIWAHARDSGYVIVTRDADFEELSTIHGAPPRMIWIRGENMSKAAILNLLLANRAVIEDALGEDGVACVELGLNIQRKEGQQTPDSSMGGFTLIELAIVMFIVSLLIGGMLLPLSAQQDIRASSETQKTLVEARDAIVGFSISKGRLPCPASANSFGQESFCTIASGACTETTTVQAHGRCSTPYDGFLPAATLGLSPVDAQGYLLDGWGGESIHRVHYAVTTTLDTYDFTSPPTSTVGIKGKGMPNLLSDLQICNSGAVVQNSGTSTADCTSNANALATDAVAVIYSLGKNAGTGGISTDELPNITADRAFVSAQPSPSFDDSLIWLSKNTLFNRMVAAGALP